MVQPGQMNYVRLILKYDPADSRHRKLSLLSRLAHLVVGGLTSVPTPCTPDWYLWHTAVGGIEVDPETTPLRGGFHHSIQEAKRDTFPSKLPSIADIEDQIEEVVGELWGLDKEEVKEAAEQLEVLLGNQPFSSVKEGAKTISPPPSPDVAGA